VHVNALHAFGELTRAGTMTRSRKSFCVSVVGKLSLHLPEQSIIYLCTWPRPRRHVCARTGAR
jgi:hypothetical protein